MTKLAHELAIIKTDDPALIKRIGRLRASVWLDEGSLIPSACKDKVWLDELDSIGKHWVVMNKNEIVAAARLTCHEASGQIPHADEFAPYNMKLVGSYCFMSRLVVKKDYRGQGLANKLDKVRLEEANRLGMKKIIILPTKARVESLLKLNFYYYGESGVHPDKMVDLSIQTYVMVCDLTICKAGRN
jgi:predicted GNAT family N-acyltransferase